jgi:type I restriction enzyme, S subunit
VNHRELDELIERDAPICYGILKPGEHVAGGVPVVKVRNFANGTIDVSNLLHTAPAIEKQYRRSRLKPGDILLSIRGTTGRVAFVPSELDQGNITQDSARIRVPEPDRRFVYHALQSPNVQRQILKKTIGQAVQGINIADVRRIRIPWLPKARREGYVRFFDQIETSVRLVGRTIAATRKMKRALMQELLTGRRRFPEFAGTPWRVMPLSEFFQEKQLRNRDESLDLVLSCSKIYGIVPQSQRFKKRLASKSVANYKVVAPGDLVYDPMLLWDASIGFVPDPYHGVVSPAYATFEFRRERGCRSFFAQALFTHAVRHQYRVVSRGTNVRRKKAMPDDFLRIKIAVPPTCEEQGRIGSSFAALDREIALLEAQREQFDQQKRGLMQMLLDGDVEIPTGARKA